MNAPARIVGVDRSRFWAALDKFSVVLTDGRLGIGDTYDEALESAMRPDADNILKVKAA